MSLNVPKTPVTLLQEFAVKHQYPHPKYEFLQDKSKMGTHINEFHVKVEVGKTTAIGTASSKQAAKHRAAAIALEIIAHSDNKILYVSSEPQKDNLAIGDTNYISQLNEMCQKLRLPCPIYCELYDIQFTFQCKVDLICTQATASNKKTAKQLAAREMLQKVKDTYCGAVAEKELLPVTNEAEVVKDTYWGAVVNSEKLLPVTSETKVMHLLKDIMKKKEIEFKNLSFYFQKRSKEDLKHIFSILGVQFKIALCQGPPPIAHASFQFKTQETFEETFMSTGSSLENAERNLIGQLYMSLDGYLSGNISY